MAPFGFPGFPCVPLFSLLSSLASLFPCMCVCVHVCKCVLRVWHSSSRTWLISTLALLLPVGASTKTVALLSLLARLFLHLNYSLLYFLWLCVSKTVLCLCHCPASSTLTTSSQPLSPSPLTSFTFSQPRLCTCIFVLNKTVYSHASQCSWCFELNWQYAHNTNMLLFRM